jgi:CheY-like chemotaxis protein
MTGDATERARAPGTALLAASLSRWPPAVGILPWQAPRLPWSETAMPTVLIVDDDASVRALWRLALARLPCQILEAADGRAALAIIRATPPDLILLDIVMPELDGWGVLRELQANPSTRAIPVVIISGHVLGDDDQVRAWGAVRLLNKPLPLPTLQAVVSDILGIAPE